MNLTPGELYFISERDHLTGKKSGYYKIGLVKSSRKGGSENRLSEHQTGNPRFLDIEHEVNAPAISSLETAMHQRFALKRVSGEWFRLTPKELRGAIVVADALAADQHAHLRSMTKAAAMAGELSTEETRRASAKDRAWFERGHQAKVALDRANKLQKLIKEFLSEALDDGQPVGDFIGKTESETVALDKKALREAHPDIHDTFEGSQPSTSKQFKLIAPGEGLDLVVPKPIQALGRRVERLLEQPSTKRAYLEELHACHLALLDHASHAEWADTLATAELQARCGTKAGIDGICTWKRAASSRKAFDDAGFRRAHPKLAAEFTVVRMTPRFGLIPMRSYSPLK
ncbi:MAG: GIY-YIG nuclease family protein [Microthrixaceae bacterium]